MLSLSLLESIEHQTVCTMELYQIPRGIRGMSTAPVNQTVQVILRRSPTAHTTSMYVPYIIINISQIVWSRNVLGFDLFDIL